MTDTTSTDIMGEVYLQISPNILESFPKFHPPVDLYHFDTSLAQVKKLHKAEVRMGKEKRAQIVDMADNGKLFLLRDDYRVYARHLSKKLGLLLVEEDFKPQEVAEIFFLAFRDRMEVFLEQPTEVSLKGMLKDLSILCEYLWADPGRVEFLTRSLNKEYGLAVHAVNTMFIGLALYTMVTRGRMNKDNLFNLGLGLIMHDMGMVNVPPFIREKEQFLVRSDRESIENHIESGVAKLKRLGINAPIVVQCLKEHHERVDGSGYPARLKGTAISIAGKITALADSYSAMVSHRPYHDPKGNADAALLLANDTKKYDQAMAKLLAILILDGGKLREVVAAANREDEES
ncbi:HD domain-containing phosphohydrolase [Pseudodesulfovibrio sp. zrk46]|uniref:HD-GYP domain-containing protein n=1 Tax=Pseudodesulfovibrio sp. zrk46 TaxID=2725288 RepID=UPI001448CF0D|nr:HD domain-containing phosphohydrolase [Pseudodesulfovibrio sp. zrk46]QJB58453.1 HD domain-containing protein [Pseudodesulfovibrio sp. zrk46]